MELLEKGFDLCTPYGNTNKKLKDFENYDFCFMSEKDKNNLLVELKEEYQSLILDNQAMKEEYYRSLTLKCKDCDSEARLKLAQQSFN